MAPEGSVGMHRPEGWQGMPCRIHHGLKITEGANGTMGVATLAAGTVVINTTAVTANSRIFLMDQNGGANAGTPYISARVAATSFTITSTNGADVSDVAWWIVEP